MAAEMAEQPGRLGALIARRHEVIKELRPLFSRRLAGSVVVARGSSDHAATVGRYLLEMATRRPASSASPSIHTLYGTEVDFEGYLVVAVSQSGQTPEIATVLEAARAGGAATVAITNDRESPLAKEAGAVIDLGAGLERAVPATKTVTAELVAFALLASAAGLEIKEDSWERLPAQVEEVLSDTAPAEELAGELAGLSRLATVARGALYGAAGEAALKLQETSSLFATAFSAADLRHGPIALASSHLPVVAFAHPGPAEKDVTSLALELEERGSSVSLLGPVRRARAGWAKEAPEELAPVLAVVRAQQLALGRARALGLDPDSPAGLTKVTVT